MDLFILQRGRRYGMEFQFAEATKVTRSIPIALADLHLTHLWIVYPGRQHYLVDEKITVWPLAEISSLLKKLR